MIVDHVIHGHRALTVSVLVRVAALVGLGVWGVVKLADGDWFIGGVLVACVLLGSQSLVTRVQRVRRSRRRGRS